MNAFAMMSCHFISTVKSNLLCGFTYSLKPFALFFILFFIYLFEPIIFCLVISLLSSWISIIWSHVFLGIIIWLLKWLWLITADVSEVYFHFMVPLLNLTMLFVYHCREKDIFIFRWKHLATLNPRVLIRICRCGKVIWVINTQCKWGCHQLECTSISVMTASSSDCNHSGRKHL